MQVQPIKFYKKQDTDYSVIKNKIIDHSEIVVNFFDHCNMRCSFCTQDHDSREGASKQEILAKVPLISDYINNNTSTVDFLLHLMGGELFQDEYIDAGFLDFYSEFIEQMQRNVRPGAVLHFNFITNLVFTRTEEVKDFFDRHKLKFAISYDPVGRFTRQEFEIFKTNVEIFKEYITLVSCQMTKQSMRKIIQGDDYFTYLYNLYECHWDHLLVGDEKLEKMMPKNSEVYAFYTHLVDNYPKCVNIRQFVTTEAKISKMGCTRGNSFTIFSDNSIPVGCSGSVVLKNNKTENNWSSKIVDNFIQENECLSCEYYSRCNLTCFVHNDYKNIVKDIDGCVYKKVFQYSDEKFGWR